MEGSAERAELEPRRVALRSLELMRSGISFVGDDYPVFLVLSFLALALGKAVPLQLLLGPAMCGVFAAFRAKSAGRRPELEHFVEGFHHLVDSIVATVVLVLVLVILMLPPAFLWACVAVFTSQAWHWPDEVVALAGVPSALCLAAWVVLISCASVFVFPAITAGGANAREALRASARGFWLNRWDVLRLVLLGWVVTLLGTGLCCVGALLVQPFVLASVWLAYREIFPGATEAPAPTRFFGSAPS